MKGWAGSKLVDALAVFTANTWLPRLVQPGALFEHKLTQT